MAESAAWQRLSEWHESGAELGFVYARSLGGLIFTGRARIARLAPHSLTLEGGGGKAVVLLGDAVYEQKPQVFFSPDLMRAHEVDGVAISLGNHDWLFVSDAAIPPEALQSLSLRDQTLLA